MPGSEYIWGTADVESRRLLWQTELYKREARQLVNRLQLQRGAQAVDLGCGPLGILDVLAEQVGPTGRVVGVELEPRFIALARQLLAERTFNNVELVAADAAETGLPSCAFDFAHSRLLLIVVREPERVVAELVRLVKPGGVVAVEEADICSWICEPVHSAWQRLFAAFETIYSDEGKDLRVGRRTLAMLRDAGLQRVAGDLHARLNGPGDFHQQQLLIFVESMRGRMLNRGLFEKEELNALVHELRTHVDDPGTVVVSPLLFQAWGYKPGETRRV
jgi:ubiquinone/menaquinone biosynthesis C-methylase UbiE